MKITSIRAYFEKRGYKLTRDLNSSNILVINKQGITKSFKSYNAAFNHYFKPQY